MKRILTNLILIPLLTLFPAAVFTSPVYAAGSSSGCGGTAAEKQVFKGIDQTASSSSGSSACDSSGIMKAISAAIEILSIIVGAAAVVAMISGSFKYITSGGDSTKVTNAKNTIIYALIGVALAALAQALVHFVINTAADTATACPYTIKDSHGKVINGLHVSDPQCKKP